MANSIELQNQRAALVAEARKLVDVAENENRDLNDTEREAWKNKMSQVDELANEIAKSQRREKLDTVEAELRQSAGRKSSPIITSRNEISPEERKAALRAWAMGGRGVSADLQLRAANCGLDLHNPNLELRAMSVGTSSLGGYTVPITLSQEIEKALKYYSNLRKFCRTITTGKGNELDWPTVTDVANQAAVVSEAGAAATNVDPTFGKVVFKSQMYHSDIVLVSYELLQDSEVDLEALLADLLAERIARKQEADFVNGAGGGTAPNGIVTASTTTVNLGSGNAITFAALKALEHSLDIRYRDNARFVMHDQTWSAIEQIVDSSGRPIFLPGYQGLSDPSRKSIFGYPVEITNQIPNYTGNEGTNEPMILFGDFTRFLIRDVATEFMLTRLQELYAGTRQVGFQLYQRAWCDRIGPTTCLCNLASYN
jgi:HK97 family phage major capsid protein